MYDFNGLKVTRRIIASTAFQYGFGYDFNENPWTWLWIKLGLMNIDHFGAFITSTITLHERQGYYTDKKKPWRNIRIYPDKVLNKFGWNNCGLDMFTRGWLEKLKTKSRKCIVSIGAVSDIDEIPAMINVLNYYHVAGIELNVSCHNIDLCFINDRKAWKKLFRDAKKISRHPIGVKINAESDYRTIAKLAQDEGLNFIHAINTTRVFSKALGGYCGQSSYRNKNIALKAIGDIRRAGITLTIIGGSGIWTRNNVRDYERAGADLFSLSHQFLYFPFWPGILATKVK